MHNDILTAVDNNRIVILLLLDLSAAFDTVDHAILLHRLEVRFGIKQKALAWFKSYLMNRSQSVSIRGSDSAPRDLLHGVPQGSVLGRRHCQTTCLDFQMIPRSIFHLMHLMLIVCF